MPAIYILWFVFFTTPPQRILSERFLSYDWDSTQTSGFYPSPRSTSALFLDCIARYVVPHRKRRSELYQHCVPIRAIGVHKNNQKCKLVSSVRNHGTPRSVSQNFSSSNGIQLVSQFDNIHVWMNKQKTRGLPCACWWVDTCIQSRDNNQMNLWLCGPNRINNGMGWKRNLGNVLGWPWDWYVYTHLIHQFLVLWIGGWARFICNHASTTYTSEWTDIWPHDKVV